MMAPLIAPSPGGTMRRTTLAAFTAAACLSLTACGGTEEVTTEPDKQAAGSQTSEPSTSEPETEAEPTPAQNAKVGDTITIKGNEDGEQVAVTLKKVADPAKPADEFFKPEDGKRWVGAQFEIVNTGSKVYADSPGNGAQIADADGQRFGTTFADISAGPSMTTDAKLPKGEKALGWIVFEVPKASKAASIQFSMNSGFGPETAQWKLQ